MLLKGRSKMKHRKIDRETAERFALLARSYASGPISKQDSEAADRFLVSQDFASAQWLALRSLETSVGAIYAARLCREQSIY